MEEHFEPFVEGSPSRKRGRVATEGEVNNSGHNSSSNNNYLEGSHAPSTTADEQPSLDIEQITSIPKLQRHAKHLEAVLEELVRAKRAEIDAVNTRIEHLKLQKRANRKRCTAEGCTNFAHRGGVCVRHGAVLKRCSVEGCNKKAQKAGTCARHGANLLIPKCIIEGCHRFGKRGGLCGFHDTVRCTAVGCNNQPTRGGLCDKHGNYPYKKKKCKVEGCDNNSKVGGVCIKHGAVMKKRKGCTVEGCTNLMQRDKLCRLHWTEKNTSIPVAEAMAKPKKNESHCLMGSCTSNHHIDNLCIRYWKEREKGNISNNLAGGSKEGGK